jgi:hypothetical protein
MFITVSEQKPVLKNFPNLFYNNAMFPRQFLCKLSLAVFSVNAYSISDLIGPA